MYELLVNNGLVMFVYSELLTFWRFNVVVIDASGVPVAWKHSVVRRLCLFAVCSSRPIQDSRPSVVIHRYARQGADMSLLLSAPSLGVYYCQQLSVSVCPSVRISVCHASSNCFFFFFVSRWNLLIFGRQFSTCLSTKLFFRFFIKAPKSPKFTPQYLHKIAYKLACVADRPEMFGPTRGFSGMADSVEPCKMLWADPCCHGNEIWAWRGDPVAYRLVCFILVRFAMD